MDKLETKTTEYLISQLETLSSKLTTALNSSVIIKSSGDKAWKRRKDNEITSLRISINTIANELEHRSELL